MTSTPHWITPAGLLYVAAELTPTVFNLAATGDNITYSVISGQLPTGLTMSASGAISGTPDAVINTVRSKFVVRAANTVGVVDRTFFIDISGADVPVWDMDSDYLKVGVNQEPWAMINQWVNFRLAAVGSALTYHLAGGDLPAGLTMGLDGVIQGIVAAPTTAIPHQPVVYQFKVSAVDTYTTTTRRFKIVVVNPAMMRADTPLLPSKIRVLRLDLIPSSVSYLQPVQWTNTDPLPVIATGSTVSIDLSARDPAPGLGPVTYSVSQGALPDNLTLDAATGRISGTVPHITLETIVRTVDWSATISATKTETATGKTVVSKKTIKLTVDDSDDPVWAVDTSYLKVGANQERYVLLNQWIDYALAGPVVSGQLPPGLTVAANGHLQGFVGAGTTSEVGVIHPPATYSFDLTVTDPVSHAVTVQTFKILVIDANMLRTDSSLLPDHEEILSLGILPVSASYLQPVQWIGSMDLGTVDDNGTLDIQVQAYDPSPETGTVTYSQISGGTGLTRLPAGLKLNPRTGQIQGTLTNPFDYTRTYSVNIVATKTDAATGNQISTTGVFNLVVRSYMEDPVWNVAAEYLKIGPRGENYAMLDQWVNYSLFALADQAPVDTTIQYYMADASGQLPRGLTLGTDGKISGFIHESRDVSLAMEHVPKIYYFKVTATDQVNTESRNFRMLVLSPNMLRGSTPWLPSNISLLDLNHLPNSVSYLQPLQWINKLDLGAIRANNNEDLPVSAYDPAPELGPVTYSLIAGESELTKLPPGLTLDSATGFIYGFVAYQPAYTKRYAFTISAVKTERATGLEVATQATFKLTVRGAVDSFIQWITPGDLGSIATGQVSELAVVAQDVNTKYSVKYQLIDGALPSGLTLAQDGTIIGRADHAAGATYTFTIQALDVYEQSGVDRTFTLTTTTVDNRQYTDIYVQPLLSRANRAAYRKFLADPFTFDPAVIYRPYDTNFGIQSEIKMTLEFGIEQLNLADYLPALRENFYKKPLYFGDVKVAVARNAENQVIYEVVYVDIVDPMINNQGISVSPVIYENNDIYYPSSITNMRNQLQLLVLDDHEYISVSAHDQPRFMRTTQAGSIAPVEYMRVVPICYVLPGQGAQIVSRIKLSGFDFKTINFAIDRLVVQSSKDSNTAKYLLLQRQSMNDPLESDSWLYGPDGIRLDQLTL